MINKKYFFLLIAIFFAFVAVDAQTEKKIGVITSTKQERQFNPKFIGKLEQKLETVEHKLSDAFATYDIRALKSLLSDDLDVMGLTAPNVKKAIIDMAAGSQKFEKEYRVTSVEKSDLRIRIVNDIGIVTGRLTIDYKKENGAGSSVQNFMNIWSKDKRGRWKCIAMSTDGQKLIHYTLF